MRDGYVSINLKYITEVSQIDKKLYRKMLKTVSLIPERMVQVSVRDNGVGIDKKDKLKLFKYFGFLDTTKELNPRGVGLGLHICR